MKVAGSNEHLHVVSATYSTRKKSSRFYPIRKMFSIQLKLSTFMTARHVIKQMLKDHEIDSFDRTEWPGSSPDLNVTENIGLILIDRVESLMVNERDFDRNLKLILVNHLQNVLVEFENENELFESLYEDRILND